MDFKITSAPYAWLCWAAVVFNVPAVVALQRNAAKLRPWQRQINLVWFAWNTLFAMLSLLGLLSTHRSGFACPSCFKCTPLRS
jgi:hypothetical protein